MFCGKAVARVQLSQCITSNSRGHKNIKDASEPHQEQPVTVSQREKTAVPPRTADSDVFVLF